METAIYLWQRNDWPNFTWDIERLLPNIYTTANEVSYFLGKISMLGTDMRQKVFVDSMSEEIYSSNAIEDILLNRDSIWSSVKTRLGLPEEDDHYDYHYDSYTDGVVQVAVDAVKNCNSPLTKQRLFQWHSLLFPTGISAGKAITTANWRRGPMYVMSGGPGKEIIHFEAPAASEVDSEMERFLSFINDDYGFNPMVKAAVAHLWFVTIHPFDDGNGRTARAITEMLLARADNTAHRFYSISSEMLTSRKAYYDALNFAQKSTMDVTSFIEYFLETMRSAVRTSNGKLEKSLDKSRFWDSIRFMPLNERQSKMINKLLDDFKGKLTTEKWAKITKCSHATALRDINDLITKGILVDDGGKTRSAGYQLKHSGP